ncbi:hypothetical protein K440DRAFT_630650 [Wilcoxina mikolae CBS 423.85]|nr:hypothetical protein K440DRAFT_630650 [Wilcoxina mikolae CBS 423.85]
MQVRGSHHGSVESKCKKPAATKFSTRWACLTSLRARVTPSSSLGYELRKLRRWSGLHPLHGLSNLVTPSFFTLALCSDFDII